MKAINDFKENIKVVSQSLDGMLGFIKLPDSGNASIVISWGGGWEHVSVAPRKTYNVPTWADMCYLKDLIFNEDEVVIQIHPKKADYVNFKSNCLHLWRPIKEAIPTPPKIFV